MIPSDAALETRWKWYCLVADTWIQADKPTIVMKPLQEHGWTVSNSELKIDWDSGENIEGIRHRVSLIKKLCTCKAECRTRHYGSVNAKYGPGCSCLNC